MTNSKARKRTRRAQTDSAAPTLPLLNDDQNYTLELGRQFLNIGRTTLYREVKAGRIRTTKIGRRSFLSGREIRRINTPVAILQPAAAPQSNVAEASA